MVFESSPTAPSSTNKSDCRKRRIRQALLNFADEKFQRTSENDDDNDHPPSEQQQVAYHLAAVVVAPISPTPPEVISRILPKLNMTPNSTVVDLGCGDGRWILAAYKEYGCRCIGCDIDDARLNLARQNSFELMSEENRRIKFVKRDVFEFLRGAEGENEDSLPLLDVVDVVIVYLFRKAMRQIAEILRERGIIPIRRGGMGEEGEYRRFVSIVSVGFTLPSYTPFWQDRFGGIRIYLYRAERLDGT